MERWIGRVALVTGASSGIGEALSEKLVKSGLKVVGCGRNETKLKALADQFKDEKGSFTPMKCDFSKEEEIFEMFSKIRSTFGTLDICVNNAGVGGAAPLLSGDHKLWKQMLDVNVYALTLCSREAVKIMDEKKIDDGHIINVSSMSGHRVLASPSGHFYTATKFAVRALTEGIRNELRQKKSHIRVTEISPGLVETPFIANVHGEGKAKEMFEGFKCLEAKDVADGIIYVLAAPPHVQIHDVLMRGTEQVS